MTGTRPPDPDRNQQHPDNTTPGGPVLRLAVDLPSEILDAIVERTLAALREQPAEPERYVDVATAAVHLACKPQRIYDLVSRSSTTGFPFCKDGSRLLFKTSEIDHWLSEQKRAA